MTGPEDCMTPWIKLAPQQGKPVSCGEWGLYGHGDPATDTPDTPVQDPAECAICSAHAGTESDPIPFHQFQPLGTPINDRALAQRGGFGFTIPDEDNPAGWMR